MLQNNMKTLFSRMTLVYWLTFFICIAAGIASTVYVWKTVDAGVKGHLEDRAETVAQIISPALVRSLQGNENDTSSEAYTQIKDVLMKVASVNTDVRFIYILGERNGSMVFLADSEPEYSEDFSPPGQIYDEATDELRALFITKEKLIEGPVRDRWGTWISALAPIVDEETGEVLGVVGLDLHAREYYQTLFVFSSLPLLVSLVLLTLIVSAYIVTRKEKRFIAAKSKFLSVASHEIRTPITGVRWASENLISHHRLHPEDEKTVELIQHSATHVLERLNLLLNMNALEHKRKVQLHKTPTDMYALISALTDSLTLFAKHRHISFSFSPAFETDIHITLDGEKVRHIFANVLSNAVKFTKPHSQIEIGYVQKKGKHLFTIADRGPGVDGSEKEKLFSGYYRGETTKNLQVGQESTGMGLYIAREYARLHGGDVTVDNRKDGVGTIVTIVL